MKKKTTKIKKEKVSIWGQLSINGTFLVTVSSVTAWLYSENPKLANEFIRKTNGIHSGLEKIRKKQEKELAEKTKSLKKIAGYDEEPEKISTENKKKRGWFGW